jgi:hypothetical protein
VEEAIRRCLVDVTWISRIEFTCVSRDSLPPELSVKPDKM